MDIVAHHWACFVMCHPNPLIDADCDVDDDILYDLSSVSSTPIEDQLPTITPPLDELVSLQRRRACLPRLPAVIERPPIACGVVKNVELLGIFPTCRWMADATMPPDVRELFGGTPFFALGEYRVANLDLLDAAGTLHPLIVVVNKGVEGLETGYWGAAFGRDAFHPCWARFQTTGTQETTVKEEHYENSKASGGGRPFFEEFDCLSFNDEHFGEGYSPGTCKTQLERILGLAVEFLVDLEWCDWLPDSLVEIRDASSKLERKNRAIERQCYPS